MDRKRAKFEANSLNAGNLAYLKFKFGFDILQKPNLSKFHDNLKKFF